ncbi:hypothetical protein AUC69_08505 [Methyloceanibacter superfactus]|uniref:Uncharacterized protein n=1 Tax=Methyloceanibacter superfactus TaxID=1774969 RepID=A0A1E3W1I8_9HYPH|nr:hypothetical protein [Methyloceanibacter superfactus]ODR99652.1 hypothetical protein AUC69_08505 [Methyloceanibacter superfactus]
MKLSPEQREERLASSREAALAFLEDMQHLREIVGKKDPSNAEIRRLSVILRRLLVERDLAIVSAPRLGRVMLVAPDNDPAYKADRKSPFLFFASGRATVLGGWAGALFAVDVVPIFGRGTVELPKLDIDKTIELRLDNFLTQRVLCYRGTWVSRKEVIEYVANVASGVHSGSLKKTEHVTLAHIRSSSRLYLKPDKTLHLELFAHGIDVDETTFRHAPDSIDPVLMELLAAAKFLTASPFVAELEEAVGKELAPLIAK